MHRARLEQCKLTLSRLNGLWSFTGQVLDHEVERYLLPTGHLPVDALLLAVSAYGCLTRAVGEAVESGWVVPAEWNWLYAGVGQALLFDIPATLSNSESKAFESLYMKSFVEGFKGGESPSSPSP